MPDQTTPSRGGGIRRRVTYRVDNVLSRGIGAPLLVLGGITLVVVLVSAAVLAAFELTFGGTEDTRWIEGFWQSVLRLMDPGTMADDVGWWARLIALLVTVVGILIVGTLIGVIASGVEQRVETMRRGRSVVAESGHVLVLGQSARLPMIVRQLALARRGRRGNVIVVLADDESGELGDEVRASAGELYSSRLVFRRGNPARAADLRRVGISNARAVIALADEDAQGDAGAVMSVLAAGAELGSFDRVPIVAELNDVETAESLVEACGGTVYPVAGLQAVARFTASALREPGLNQVVGELLDFRGADIYVRELNDLSGLSFGETTFRFSAARPIGYITSAGVVELNPDPTTLLDDLDRLILIAENADGLASKPEHGSTPAPRSTGTPTRPDRGLREEHLLVIGWNKMGAQLLAELDERAAPGSSVEVVYDARLFDPNEIDVQQLGRFDVRLTPSRALTWRLGDAARSSSLTSVALLGYRRRLSVEEADSRTLLNLMLLRRQLDLRAGAPPRVIVELLDPDNVDLPRGTSADDFVISDAIVSRMMTQVAEQPERRPILLSLYASDSASIQLVAVDDLGLQGEVGFDEIVTSAYFARLVAIGWRRSSRSDGELVLNPPTSRRVDLRAGDHVVVVG